MKLKYIRWKDRLQKKKKKLNLNDYYPGSLITDGLNGLISTREVLFSVHKLNSITLS